MLFRSEIPQSILDQYKGYEDEYKIWTFTFKKGEGMVTPQIGAVKEQAAPVTVKYVDAEGKEIAADAEVTVQLNGKAVAAGSVAKAGDKIVVTNKSATKVVTVKVNGTAVELVENAATYEVVAEDTKVEVEVTVASKVTITFVYTADTDLKDEIGRAHV